MSVAFKTNTTTEKLEPHPTLEVKNLPRGGYSEARHVGAVVINELLKRIAGKDRELAKRDEEINRHIERAEADAYVSTVLNKRAIQEHIKECVATGKPVGAFFIDLNSFKKINDNASGDPELGYHAGDEILTRFGELLSEKFRRETDKLGTGDGGGDESPTVSKAGRFGGDEFILVVDLPPGTAGRREYNQMDAAEDRLREIEAQLQAEFPVATGIGFGFAIGGAWYDPASPNPVDASMLMEQAIEAMKEDKGDKAR